MTISIFGIQIELKKEVIAVIVTVLVFLAGLGGYLIIKSNRDIIIDSESSKSTLVERIDTTGNETENEKINMETVSENKKEEIKIYVVGCVNNPGIVTLEKGQLIDDAVKLAGGFTKDADPQEINLVYKLEENLMLCIRSKKELLQSSQNTAEAGEAGKGVTLVRDSGGAVVNEPQNAGSSNARVNINTASVSELDTLPGIGEATARDIISYRENNGLFKTIQDIMKVPRIKESRFASIKDFITVN